MPKAEKQLTRTQELMILDNIKEKKYKIAWTIGIKTGMRIFEICNLKLENIHFDKGLIIFIPQKQRANKKERIILMDEEIKIILKKWIYENQRIIKTKGFLFYSKYSNRTNINSSHYNGIIREAAQKAGINKVYKITKDGRRLWTVSSHSARHSKVTELLNKFSGDILKVQKLMTFKSIETVLNYEHIRLNKQDLIKAYIEEE